MVFGGRRDFSIGRDSDFWGIEMADSRAAGRERRSQKARRRRGKIRDFYVIDNHKKREFHVTSDSGRISVSVKIRKVNFFGHILSLDMVNLTVDIS